MAGDYIPHADTKLRSWANNFLANLEEIGPELGIDPALLQILSDKTAEFSNSYAEHMAAQNAAAAARSAKDAAHRELVTIARAIAQQVQANINATDTQKTALDITTTGGTASPSAVNLDSTPYPIIDISSRLKHVIRIQNKTDMGVERAKPAGVIGCEVWRKVGESPNGMEDMAYTEFVLGGVVALEYDGADAGKSAHYALRWVSKRGGKGTWSGVTSATIAA